MATNEVSPEARIEKARKLIKSNIIDVFVHRKLYIISVRRQYPFTGYVITVKGFEDLISVAIMRAIIRLEEKLQNADVGMSFLYLTIENGENVLKIFLKEDY